MALHTSGTVVIVEERRETIVSVKIFPCEEGAKHLIYKTCAHIYTNLLLLEGRLRVGLLTKLVDSDNRGECRTTFGDGRQD